MSAPVTIGMRSYSGSRRRFLYGLGQAGLAAMLPRGIWEAFPRTTNATGI